MKSIYTITRLIFITQNQWVHFAVFNPQITSSLTLFFNGFMLLLIKNQYFTLNTVWTTYSTLLQSYNCGSVCIAQTLRHNYFCSVKAMVLRRLCCVWSFSEHSMRIRHFKLPSVSCPALPYFSKLSNKCYVVGEKKMLLDIKCVFWFSLNIFLRKIYYSKNYSARYYYKCKQVFILVRFYSKFNFLDGVWENSLILNSMKMCPNEIQMFGADENTDRQTWRT